MNPRARAFAEGLFLGMLIALVVSIAALLRTGEDVPRVRAFVVLLGGAATLLAPCTGALRSLRGELRSLAAPVVALLFAAGPVAVFGALLQARTHHRQLGAVTFAILALVAFTLSLLVARRALSSGRVWRRAAVLLAVPSGAFTVLALVRGSPGEVRWALVDAAICGGLSLLAVRYTGRLPRAVALMPVLWLASCGISGAVMQADCDLGHRLSVQVPVALGLGRLWCV